MNPYAPPGQVAMQPADAWGSAEGGALRPVGSGGLWIRWVILASFISGIPSFVAGWSMIQPGARAELAPIGIALSGLGALCMAAYGVLVFVWIGLSWSMIPPEGRRTRSGRMISPGEAVGYHFIPFFNLYWVFVASVGLCDAIDRQLAALRVSARSPRGLAVAASIVQVLPYVNFVFGPFLWIPYMFLVDGAKTAYRRAAGSAP